MSFMPDDVWGAAIANSISQNIPASRKIWDIFY